MIAIETIGFIVTAAVIMGIVIAWAYELGKEEGWNQALMVAREKLQEKKESDSK